MLLGIGYAVVKMMLRLWGVLIFRCLGTQKKLRNFWLRSLI